MILAAITVVQCDNCPEIESLKTESDVEAFEKKWHDGILFHFCPNCRNKYETQERVVRDKNLDYYLNTLSNEKTDHRPRLWNWFFGRKKDAHLNRY